MNLELAIKTLRENGYTVSKRKATVKAKDGFADYDMAKVRNAKVAFPSPVIAATFEDGEYIRMSFATTVGKPLNVGRAVRVAIDAYDARGKVRDRQRIARERAEEIHGHEDVRAAREKMLDARFTAIEAAEGFNALGPEPSFGAENYREWRKAEQLAKDLSERYSDRIAHVAHAKAHILDTLVKAHRRKVKVPAINHAHIEISGKKVATLDLAKVNATAKAKVNGGLH